MTATSSNMKVTRYNLPHAFKKGIPSWNKGKKMSDETKKKLSDFNKGKLAWNKGKKCPWVSKRNSINNPLHRGKNAYHWKGGTYGTERQRLMRRSEYKQWRSDVFSRDNWRCQTCQKRGNCLEAHHIKPWSKYPEFRYDVSNGITLCTKCHKLVRTV